MVECPRTALLGRLAHRVRAARRARASRSPLRSVPSRSRISAANASSWSATRRAARSPALVRRTREARASSGSGSRATRPSFSSRSRLRVSVLGLIPSRRASGPEPHGSRASASSVAACATVSPQHETSARSESEKRRTSVAISTRSCSARVRPCRRGAHICNIQLESRTVKRPDCRRAIRLARRRRLRLSLTGARRRPWCGSGGDLVADVLVRHGVRFLFTLCGGHISPILVAAKARGVRVVDTRHEATAVFAADAVARLTGRPGRGRRHRGARRHEHDHGAQERPARAVAAGAARRRDGDAAARPRRAAGHRPAGARAAARQVRPPPVARARPRAGARAGVPHLALPACPGRSSSSARWTCSTPKALVRGWYGAKATGTARGLAARAERWYVARHLDGCSAARARGTTPSQPARRQPAPAAGRGPRPPRSRDCSAARNGPCCSSAARRSSIPPARASSIAAIRALGLPVYLSGMARGLLGAADPLQLRHRRKEALREADLVLLAGVPCDFRLDYGRQIGRRRGSRLREPQPRGPAANRRPTLAVPSAPDRFLRQLAAQAGPRPEWRSWLEPLRGRDAARDAEIEAQAGCAPEHGRNPIALCRAIERALGATSMVVADGGDFVATASYVLRPRGPLSWLDPGPFGTLGVGAGFALGAKLARPEAEVFLLYGDGALGYSLAEADTFARHGLGVVAVIGNDAGWTQIAREQVELLKDDVATVLAPTDYERAAEGLGARGLRLDASDDLDASSPRPVRSPARGAPVYVNAAPRPHGLPQGLDLDLARLTAQRFRTKVRRRLLSEGPRLHESLPRNLPGHALGPDVRDRPDAHLLGHDLVPLRLRRDLGGAARLGARRLRAAPRARPGRLQPRARGAAHLPLRPLDPARAVADRARALPSRPAVLLLRRLAAAVPARRDGALDAVRDRAPERGPPLLRGPARGLARGARDHVPALLAGRRERRPAGGDRAARGRGGLRAPLPRALGRRLARGPRRARRERAHRLPQHPQRADEGPLPAHGGRSRLEDRADRLERLLADRRGHGPRSHAARPPLHRLRRLDERAALGRTGREPGPSCATGTARSRSRWRRSTRRR